MEATKWNNLRSVPIVLGALGVSIGAFGAHMLQPLIEETGRQSTWDTAMHYYWIHVLAMLILTKTPQAGTLYKSHKRCVFIWLISMVLFCGSLYSLALGAPNVLGAITPIGGLGFIIGWICLLPTSSSKTKKFP